MSTITTPEPVIVSRQRGSKLLIELRFPPVYHEVGAYRTISDRWYNVRKTSDHPSTTALCGERSEGQRDAACFWKLDRERVLILPRYFQEGTRS